MTGEGIRAQSALFRCSRRGCPHGPGKLVVEVTPQDVAAGDATENGNAIALAARRAAGTEVSVLGDVAVIWLPGALEGLPYLLPPAAVRLLPGSPGDHRTLASPLLFAALREAA